MKRIFIFIVSTIMITFSSLTVSANNMREININGVYNYDMANEILDIMNNYRNKHGLKSLKSDKTLTKIANTRAREISVYYSHTRPDGSDCFTLSNKFHGENIAEGCKTARDVMDSWINSEGHRENILKKDYKSVGISVFIVNGYKFYAQDFSYNSAKQEFNKTGRQSIKSSVNRLDKYIGTLHHVYVKDIVLNPKHNFFIKYNRVKGCDGYQVQICKVNTNDKKVIVNKYVKKNKIHIKKKLKSNKKYRIRVRAYSNYVTNNHIKKRAYSNWCAVNIKKTPNGVEG